VKVARVVTMMLLGIFLTLLVQLWDKRRLGASHRWMGGWNTASWGAALYAFGPLSMLGWSWVTRPRWRRVWFGPVAMGVLLLVMTGIDAALGAASGDPIDDGWLDVAMAAGASSLAGVLLLAVMDLVVSLWRRLRSPRSQPAKPRGS